MKLGKSLSYLSALLAGVAALQAQTPVESFEYATAEDLTAAWAGSANATVTRSDSVSPKSTGTASMKVEFNFPSTAFTTEFINGPERPEPLLIGPTQYVSFRVKGDPAFKTADFRNLYLYAYDADGNFGRWGAPVSTSDAWQVVNYLASTVEKPWNSTALPDLSRIVRFAFYQYGSEAAIAAYQATIYLDDVTVRDTPLVEAPPVTESVVETFEYATPEDLTTAWTGSANAVVTVSDSVAPTSTGLKAMKVQFNFPSTAWATESVAGPTLPAPIYIAPEQYVSFRLKGDAAFTAADFRNLYLYAYDAAGNFGRWGIEAPTTDTWQIVNFRASNIEKPWDSTALPDMTQLVRFSFFQYGSETAIPAYTATIQLDDVTVRNSALVEVPVTQDFMVEPFEHATTEDLTALWIGSANAVVTIAEDVSPRSSGQKAMKLEFNFPSGAWATEFVKGPLLETPVAIGSQQYLTFRLKGDPAFSAADFRNLYLYVYDADGNFGRWGAAVPITSDWKVFNFSAASIEKPWDSTALPNLGQIVRFAFYQYGSETALPAYTATLLLDELMVRNAPLNEFPLPANPRPLIEDFEGYADTAGLLGFYSYINSPATTVTTATVETPAPQGSKALKLAIDFSAGQYPWGSVRSPVVAPFSFPANAVVSVRFKGDPTLATVADGGTSFWLTFYDASGRAISYIAPAATVTAGEWTTLQASLADFGDTSAVDVGSLVQWRILVQGWEGTVESAALSGAFYVDEILMTVPPATQVSGVAPPGLTGAPFTNIVVDETGKTITADLPAGNQGFLTITPARTITSVTVENGKLVVRW